MFRTVIEIIISRCPLHCQLVYYNTAPCDKYSPMKSDSDPEVPDMASADDGYHREISETLAGFLEKYVENEETKNRNADNEKEHSKEKGCSILTVGLGNREVTPDALGPYVVDQLNITRHMVQEYGRYGVEEESRIVSAIVPGVMAQTGMETAEIVQGVVKETKPDMILVIDALAARSIRRLGRTIQLTDTGITPGSGIGNHRNAINRKSVGVPVISLGVPTVVDAATIVSDAMTEFISALSLSDLQKLDERERQELARELLSPQLNGLFVTPKNIDDSIKNLSFLISEGLNIALLGDKEE